MTSLMLDASHGGKDPGAVGANSTEKAVSLAIAQKVKHILAPIVNVKMTRTDDSTVDLATRANLANADNVDYFVSIHCNGFGTPEPNGIETWHYPGDTQGRVLAKLIQTRLVNALQLNDRGVKQCVPGTWSDFYVLKHTKMSACLVEIGFLTNPQDEALMITEEGQSKAALAIAQGISDFIGVRIPDGPKIVIGDKVYKGEMVGKMLHGPIRAMFEGLGYSVTWDAETETAYIKG